jgi:hypothetical protein
MSNNESTSFKNSRPPRNAATDPEDAILSFVTSAVAVSANLWASYTSHDSLVGPPKGKVWLEVEALGNDCYIRFSRTASTGTTSSNGLLLKVGFPRFFYIDPNFRDKFLDVLATGAGVLKYRVVSSVNERSVV